MPLVLAVLGFSSIQAVAQSTPTSVGIPGSYQSEAGCGGDWDPACPATQLIYDANGDGFRDLLVGAPFAGSAGALFVYSGAGAPQVTALAVDRGDYRATHNLTLLGARFAQGDQLQVEIGGVAATNVTVVDDATITATTGPGDPGPCDVTVHNTLGDGMLAGGFRRTPAVLLEGTWAPGGHVAVHHLYDPGDGVFTLFGVPPLCTIPSPPFLRDRIEGPTPLHLIDAPRAGTGKGLLASVLSYPAAGERVPSLQWSDSERERAKLILGVLRSGAPIIKWDNVTGRIDSPTSR
jgi:hypothetical protein